jgi:hypothetical protein
MAPTMAQASVPSFVDWGQYNLEYPEEDVSAGWISSDEENYDTDEQIQPTPLVTCASCRSPLVLHADLHSYSGRVVCTRSALLPPITIRRGGVQCKCGTSIGRLQSQHPSSGPVPVTLARHATSLPSSDRLPPLRQPLKSGAMYDVLWLGSAQAHRRGAAHHQHPRVHA